MSHDVSRVVLATRNPGKIAELGVLLAPLGLTVVGEVATLPFGVALRRLGLSEGLVAGTWSEWSVDQVKGVLVTVISTSIALIALVGCMRRLPRLWPAVAGLAAQNAALATSMSAGMSWFGMRLALVRVPCLAMAGPRRGPGAFESVSRIPNPGR